MAIKIVWVATNSKPEDTVKFMGTHIPTGLTWRMAISTTELKVLIEQVGWV